MDETVCVVTASSNTVSIYTTTTVSSILDPPGGSHCRGPLDGSLYAKVKKSRKSANGEVVLKESSPDQVNVVEPTAREPVVTSTCINPNVVVLNGNRIIYKPLSNPSSPTIKAPLANLSEFSSVLSIASCEDSFPSFSTVTKLSVTSSESSHRLASEFPPPRYQEIMADGSTDKAAVAIADDVIRDSVNSKDKKNGDVRFSGISCSSTATTLSSTTSGDDGPREELSDNDTSDSSSIHDVQIDSIEGVLSPITVEGNLAPDIFGETSTKKDLKLEENLGSSAPTIPAPPVPRAQGTFTQYDSTGQYKSSEYAVPMRDMKITTVSSKRAVLVSTGGDNDDMASPSSDRRDSVYDEGNTYLATGYSTIEEYEEQHSLPQKSPEPEERSYIPEDVQELLNGLTECAPISDIDSGFHGSSMALQSTSQQGNNVTSQSSSEMGESVGSPGPALSNKDLSPSIEQNYVVTPERNSPEAMNPQVMAKVSFFDAQARTERKGRRVSFESRNVETEVPPINSMNVSNEPAIIPKKNTNPGIPIPTQTMPEPQPAQVQIITMRNVFTNGQSIGMQQQGCKQVEEKTKLSSTLKTQPSATEYQHHPSKTTEKPPLPAQQTISPTNSVTLRHQNEIENVNDESDVEDEIDSENIRSMEEQIKHTQRHLEFLKEQQEKLVKRKQDRTKFRESLKRNSTNYDRYSQGYGTAPFIVNNAQHDIQQTPTVRRQSSSSPVEKSPEMPPVSNVAHELGRPVAAQHVTSQNSWNGGHILNHTETAATSYPKTGPTRSQVQVKEEKPVLRRHQEKDDIIMSSDLQEQLAELDKCIAELTTSMDIPDPQEPIESVTMRPKRSYTMEIERKMDPNVKQDPSPVSPVPNPPRRSKSSFDSYKRLSQDFDLTTQRRSFTEQSSPDDVFTPGGPNTPRLKKTQSPFPPQTSVTRRQHAAPQPPPKRRLSLEERLSPVLVQALTSNPGAKPKEDIHSYKEDLAPENLPSTPTFPITPSTPYVNADPTARAKSPVGLVKTPLSVLHLQPTDKPKDGLSPTEHLKTKEQQSPTQRNSPEDDIVDGLVKEFQSSAPEPQIQATVALQNSLAKETDLLNDEIVLAEPDKKEDTHQHSPVNTQPPEEVPSTPVAQNAQVVMDNSQPQIVHQPEPPTSLDLSNGNPPNGHLNKIQLQLHQEQQSPTPHRQYLLHNSSGSHSSHSPAATSSNSRRGSSDSLDGPSTRHSNSSILSSSSSSSATQNAMHGFHPAQLMRPGSQMSNYERHLLPGSASGTRSGDESFGSPQSGRTSSSSISDVEKMNYDVSHATVSTAPKFIRDTTAYWYKPNISREEALAILRPKPAGSFVVRDSRCFPGAFGLALKVDKLPTNLQLKPGADIANEYVRHFLIEPSSKGVKLKGCPNEPVFGSLTALVYQHSITPLALPCKLIIPTIDQEVPKPPSPQARQPEPVASPQATANELLKQGAACNVIYIGCVDTESLTGPLAIERAIRETYQVARTNPNTTSIVHFKVTPQGITLTDNARKLFFRKHYPTDTVTFCGLDPMGGANKSNKFRRWDATGVKGSPDAWLFGFVARKQAGASGNTCLVFAELDPAQPARAIVNFVMKVLIGFSRQNSSS